MNDPGNQNDIVKEVAYYKSQVNTLSGAVMGLEYKLAGMSNEIKQMRKGFSLIAGLQQHKQISQPEDLYDHFTEQVNVQMQMDHSLVLLPVMERHCFVPAHLKGYSIKDAEELKSEIIRLPETFVNEKRSLLVNSQTKSSPFTELLTELLQTRYFILTPVIVLDEIVAFIFTGRKVEVLPLAASRLLIHDLHALEAIAGVIAAIKNQFEQFRLLEEERTRIAREMHDDIGSELTKIRMFSQVLMGSAVADSVEQETLKKISLAASNVLGNVNEIIWTMNSQNDYLDNLTAYIRRYASEYLETHSLLTRIDFPGTIPSVSVSNHFRRNLVLVVKEALHNVVKHAKAANVGMTLTYDGGIMSISIEDDGTGIIQDIKRGNGIKSMEQRIKDIGGKLVIASGSNGTTLSVAVKLEESIR